MTECLQLALPFASSFLLIYKIRACISASTHDVGGDDDICTYSTEYVRLPQNLPPPTVCFFPVSRPLPSKQSKIARRQLQCNI